MEGFASLSPATSLLEVLYNTVYTFIYVIIFLIYWGCIHIPCGLCLSEN